MWWLCCRRASRPRWFQGDIIHVLIIHPLPALPNCDRTSLHGCCCEPTKGKWPKLFKLEDAGLASLVAQALHNKKISGWWGVGLSGGASQAGGRHPQLDRGDHLQHRAGRHVCLPTDSLAREGNSSCQGGRHGCGCLLCLCLAWSHWHLHHSWFRLRAKTRNFPLQNNYPCSEGRYQEHARQVNIVPEFFLGLMFMEAVYITLDKSLISNYRLGDFHVKFLEEYKDWEAQGEIVTDKHMGTKQCCLSDLYEYYWTGLTHWPYQSYLFNTLLPNRLVRFIVSQPFFSKFAWLSK